MIHMPEKSMFSSIQTLHHPSYFLNPSFIYLYVTLLSIFLFSLLLKYFQNMFNINKYLLLKSRKLKSQHSKLSTLQQIHLDIFYIQAYCSIYSKALGKIMPWFPDKIEVEQDNDYHYFFTLPQGGGYSGNIPILLKANLNTCNVPGKRISLLTWGKTLTSLKLTRSSILPSLVK